MRVGFIAINTKIRKGIIQAINCVQNIYAEIDFRVSKILSFDIVKNTLVILAIIVFAYLFGKRIAIEHLRTVIVFSILFFLAATSINLKSGIIALAVYLPFMAFIRRFIYIYGRYVAVDPILIVSDVITIWMFGYLAIFKRREIWKSIRENRIARLASLLLVLFFLQMFNPKQGSIFVGIGGAKYYIVPLFWFYFGIFLDRKFILRVLQVVAFIGFITALYGLKQTFIGFTSFENYWIEYGGYSALHLWRIIRSFSTFASAGEYAHYLTFAGIICLAFVLVSRNRALSFIALGTIMTALFISAVRSAVFAFFASAIIMIGFLMKDRAKGILFILLFGSFIALFIARVGIVPKVDIYNPLSVTTQHALKGITNPMSESSFESRIYLWTVDFPKKFIANPFGYGLGISTLAAWKFGAQLMATESLLLDIILSTGIVGAIMFFLLLYFIFLRVMKLIKKAEYKLIAIISLVLSLSYLFIGSSSEYSIFPIVWLLWGTIAGKACNNEA